MRTRQQLDQGQLHAVVVLQTHPHPHPLFKPCETRNNNGHRVSVVLTNVTMDEKGKGPTVLKHWRVTQERIEKFLSDVYFTDVNLKGR